MRLLLISNSFSTGLGYLDHCAEEIQHFLKNVNSILFFPYALHDHQKYADFAGNRFKQLGYTLFSIHNEQETIDAISKAEAIFVGGGNTFRLLNTLYNKNLLGALRERILTGIPYIGASAGANIASPTIMTTNDMPIMYPPSLNALDVIPFQINPHYFDPDPNCNITIESREQRIKEYHEENDLAVLALYEGSLLSVENSRVFLKGKTKAKLFRKGTSPIDIVPVSDVSFLLSS